MTGYVLSGDADRDLTEIWGFIAADNIDAADRWIDTLFGAFEAISLTLGVEIDPRYGFDREYLRRE
ncbi:MAG: type II toxin-antitoxin system RelE/ParE family toxin [Acidobacteriota bacterium]